MSSEQSAPTFEPQLCGWTPNPAACEAFHARPEMQQAFAESSLLGTKGVSTYLWKPLLMVKPDWHRGTQGIGDCVSWGMELACTMLMAIQHFLNVSTFSAEAATEPIYGGSRVESQGGGLGGYSDGSWGSAAADWVMKWGVLLRQDYSKQTGIAEHDLTKYSADKAKAWGNFGCGGKSDGGRGDGLLDKVARMYPVKAVTKVKDVDHAAALLESGYPITVASNVGYGNMRRDERGVVRRSGTWEHQMMYGGVVWIDGRPYPQQFQSWGKSASGPFPNVTEQAVLDCSWLCTPDDANVQIKQGDTWAISDLRGFPPRGIDWNNSGLV